MEAKLDEIVDNNRGVGVGVAVPFAIKQGESLYAIFADKLQLRAGGKMTLESIYQENKKIPGSKFRVRIEDKATKSFQNADVVVCVDSSTKNSRLVLINFLDNNGNPIFSSGDRSTGYTDKLV